MSTGESMVCENPECGVDITMAGAPMCPYCDPTAEEMIERDAERVSPTLCDKCFVGHVATCPKRPSLAAITDEDVGDVA